MENVSFEFLKSKRFISAASYVVALILVAYLPIFEGMELDIASGLTIVFGILIGGYSVEDALKVLVIAREMAKKTETNVDDDLLAAIYAAATTLIPTEKPAVEVNVGGATH